MYTPGKGEYILCVLRMSSLGALGHAFLPHAVPAACRSHSSGRSCRRWQSLELGRSTNNVLRHYSAVLCHICHNLADPAVLGVAWVIILTIVIYFGPFPSSGCDPNVHVGTTEKLPSSIILFNF